MSQNRQDRLKAHNDYLLDLKTEEESKAVLEMLAAQNNALDEIYQELQELKRGDGKKQQPRLRNQRIRKN
jgi:uncharacterized membrane protein